MSLPPDIHYRSLAEVADLLRRGEIKSVELTEALLARISEHEPVLNAFIRVTGDLALEQARRADAAQAKGQIIGPLHGVPVAIKDLLVTKGIPTTFASRAYEDYITDYDASVVTRLVEAGAVIVGKTNLSEGAACSSSLSSAFGGPANPWNTDYITGGSSGGSAAAVAAGLAYGAIGSDTAMSIRQPAAVCGIVGLKPTFGVVPKYGAMSLSFSLDHLGPMTRDVRDAALMLQVLAGADPKDPTSVTAPEAGYANLLGQDVRGARLAVMRDAHFAPSDPQWAAAAERALDALRDQGAEVEDVALPGLDDLMLVASTIIAVEGASFHAARFKTAPEKFGPAIRGLTEVGQSFSGVQYVQAQRARRMLTDDFLAAFAGYDALVLPTTQPATTRIADEAPGMITQRLPNTLPFNALGLPAITVPSGLDDNGLPIGVQFVGQAFAEARILQLAHAYERASGNQGRHPDI